MVYCKKNLGPYDSSSSGYPVTSLGTKPRFEFTARTASERREIMCVFVVRSTVSSQRSGREFREYCENGDDMYGGRVRMR